MSTLDGSPTFLLVHGAYHRSTAWAPLRERLAAKGLRSDVVDMPSAGEQREPTAGLYADAEELDARVRSIEGPVVVVGHSHSGLTVTQMDDHPNVVHLVYIAAFMAAEDESAGSMAGIPIPEDVSGVLPRLEDPRNSLYGDLPDEEAARWVGQLVDQSLRSCCEATTRAAWRAVPSTYVICDNDQQLAVPFQEKCATRATTVERMPTSHSPFLSQPERVADLFARIAADLK